MTAPILEVSGLSASFPAVHGPDALVLDGVDFAVQQGEILGIVGESGSGKTMTALSILQLLPRSCRIDNGEILLNGRQLLKLGDRAMNKVRGQEISMIFQNPRTSLNPLLRVGTTLTQILRTHGGMRGEAAHKRALELLRDVGLSDGERILKRYPHELSGGMCQRVMIAFALASEPKLLIADEPTTALDVTVQLQVIELLAQLRREHGLSLLLITHNLSVVAEVCDRVLVMYLGRVVEQATVLELFDNPRHPYTTGLLASRPTVQAEGELQPIPGSVPDLRDRPSGCPFHPRCSYAVDECGSQTPPVAEVSSGHSVACHRWQEVKV